MIYLLMSTKVDHRYEWEYELINNAMRDGVIRHCPVSVRAIWQPRLL